MDLIEIGISIREARKSKKITLMELGHKLGMSPSTLSLLENGSIEELGIRKVMRVMDALGLELSSRPIQMGYTFEDASRDIAKGPKFR
jgi:transcriptional regulator with XRE-family HTH domain